VSRPSSTSLDTFEKFIFKAEFTVANIFALLAGILLDPRIGFIGMGIATVIAMLRIFAKPFYARRIIRLVHNDANGGELPFQSALYLGTARQSPILLALAVGMVLLEPSDFNKRLLAIVVLAGLLSELLPIVAGYLRGPGRLSASSNDRLGTGVPGGAPPEAIGGDRQ